MFNIMSSLEEKLNQTKSREEKISLTFDFRYPIIKLLGKEKTQEYFYVLNKILYGLIYFTPKDLSLFSEIWHCIRKKLDKRYFHLFINLEEEIKEYLKSENKLRNDIAAIEITKENKRYITDAIIHLDEIETNIANLIQNIPSFLLLTKGIYKEIKKNSLEQFRKHRKEACGCLAGKYLSQDLVEIYKCEKLYITENISKEPDKSYLINFIALLKADKGAESLGLDIITYYHSHPTYNHLEPKDARLSEADLKSISEYGMHGFNILIYSIEYNELRAWKTNKKGYEELKILYI